MLITPVSLFECKSKLLSWVNLKSDEGREPMNLFPAKPRSFNILNSPTDDGMSELSLFPPNCSVFRLLRRPIVVGIDDVKLLKFKRSDTSPDKYPNSLGIMYCRLFWERNNTINFVNDPMERGIDDLSLLADMSKRRISLRPLIDAGIEDVKLLLETLRMPNLEY